MDSLDLFAQRYESFNLPRLTLKHYESEKDKLGEVYSFLINQAKQKNNHM